MFLVSCWNYWQQYVWSEHFSKYACRITVDICLFLLMFMHIFNISFLVFPLCDLETIISFGFKTNTILSSSFQSICCSKLYIMTSYVLQFFFKFYQLFMLILLAVTVWQYEKNKYTCSIYWPHVSILPIIDDSSMKVRCIRVAWK